MTIDPRQFLETIIRPTLMQIDLYSEAAAELLWGTAAQESHFQWRRQLGNGPARGLFQVEPFTHDDIWKNYLAYHKDLADKIRALILPTLPPGADQMIDNDRYACAMARVKYLRVKSALPDAGDTVAQAHYYKQWFNTPLGAATAEEYLDNWHRFCAS